MKNSSFQLLLQILGKHLDALRNHDDFFLKPEIRLGIFL
jgi:hypothetical protein